MKRFAELFEQLDATTATNEKVTAMVAYFSEVTPDDAAWALYFLSGRRPKRLIATPYLRQWLLEATGLPDWLFEECYTTVGDLAETIALLCNIEDTHAADEALSLSQWMQQRILPLREQDSDTQKKWVLSWWKSLNRQELFILNKLLTGNFRVGVSQPLAVRALAAISDAPATAITQRLMGNWEPSADFYRQLMQGARDQIDLSQPYPFYLASQLDRPFAELGAIEDWLLEWKWDGIRAQLIRRQDRFSLWSRGEDLITERFPELIEAAQPLLAAGTVLDGEILAFRDGAPLPFAILQKRIGKLRPSPKLIQEAPVAFMAYDMLEENGQDLRDKPLQFRRERLALLVRSLSPRFLISPNLEVSDWESLAATRAQARAQKVEGIMLKRLDSVYGTGRKRGDWWKWKVDPYTVDAVLIYAQAGHGRRATLFTDYTFAVWHQGELVPVAKAYSGLTDEEIRKLDQWIRAHTKERFGPVRSVEPALVFELAFENIQLSSRHKSGVAVRFPRILRWREDKPAIQADTLDNLKSLIQTAH